MSKAKTVQPFVFDWKREPESFLKWLLPTVMVGVSSEQMAELADATKEWSEVRVQVLINGVEVNAQQFFEGVERNMDDRARRAAKDMLDEVGGFDALEERIREIRAHLIAKTEEALRERGIELPEEGSW